MGSNGYGLDGNNYDNSGMVYDVLVAIIICLVVAAIICWALS